MFPVGRNSSASAKSIQKNGKPNQTKPLLPPISKGKQKTVVLEMDNTLVESFITRPSHWDFTVMVEEKECHFPCYVLKRPAVDTLLLELAQNNYEIVVFTSTSKGYANPILDALDAHKIINHRLFRDSMNGHVKDLSNLGRDLKNVFMVDDNLMNCSWHPENAFLVKPFHGDVYDKELWKIIDFAKMAAASDDVREALKAYFGASNGNGNNNDSSEIVEVNEIISELNSSRKTIVLGLFDTLVYASFKPLSRYDYQICDALPSACYVLKRPGVDELLSELTKYDYEIVVFTTAIKEYADLILDKIDVNSAVGLRLYNDSCRTHEGGLVKDLDVLGRDLRNVIIVDHDPVSYKFQPDNAFKIKPFKRNPRDKGLYEVIEFCKEVSTCEDVRKEIRMKKKKGSRLSKALCRFFGSLTGGGCRRAERRSS